MEPLVSVLMTSYNREDFIADAIKSVLASTYKNFELIVSDDNSTDKTVEIVKQFTISDPRVKLFINQHNLGDYKNRNMAASYASGKYLKYVDADDLIYPWGLQVMVECMERYPEAGYGLCSMPQDKKQIYPILLSPAETYYRHYNGMGIFTRAPLSSIIKATVFSEAGGFTPLRMVGDFEMWHRLALNNPVVLMPQGMVWYRMHESQEMNQYGLYELEYKRISIEYIKKENCPLSPEEKENIVRKVRKLASKKLLRDLGRGRLADFATGKQKMQMSLLSILKNLWA